MPIFGNSLWKNTANLSIMSGKLFSRSIPLETCRSTTIAADPDARWTGLVCGFLAETSGSALDAVSNEAVALQIAQFLFARFALAGRPLCLSPGLFGFEGADRASSGPLIGKNSRQQARAPKA